MNIRDRTDYVVQIREDEYGTNPDDENIDVTVEFSTGERYFATVFTVENLRTLMRRYRETGECADGLYVWASHMIVVEQVTRQNVERLVKDLIASEEFSSAFDGPVSGS